jgi:translation initiation factor IF-2
VPVRIYALAKDLNVDSKELVEICRKAGIAGKGSALASLTDEEADKVKGFLSGEKKKPESGAARPGASARPNIPESYSKNDYIAPGQAGRIRVLDVARKPAEKPKEPKESAEPKEPIEPLDVKEFKEPQGAAGTPTAGTAGSRRRCRSSRSRSQPEQPQPPRTPGTSTNRNRRRSRRSQGSREKSGNRGKSGRSRICGTCANPRTKSLGNPRPTARRDAARR